MKIPTIAVPVMRNNQFERIAGRQVKEQEKSLPPYKFSIPLQRRAAKLHVTEKTTLAPHETHVSTSVIGRQIGGNLNVLGCAIVDSLGA